MAKLTGVPEWAMPMGCKRLILEHRMAARRMGFLDMFAALHEVEDFRTGLLDGSLPCVHFFAKSVFPLLRGRDDQFALAKIVRRDSPLLLPEMLRQSENPEDQLRKAREAVATLLRLWIEMPTLPLAMLS